MTVLPVMISRIFVPCVWCCYFNYRLVYEDGDHGLFTVTLFKKVVDEFKLHARDKK